MGPEEYDGDRRNYKDPYRGPKSDSKGFDNRCSAILKNPEDRKSWKKWGLEKLAEKRIAVDKKEG